MVGIGLFLIALFATAFYFSARHRFERHRWFLRLALFSLPLPWLAAELGWIVAEYGRQPWAIDGLLPTFLGVSATPEDQRAVVPDGFRDLLFRPGRGRRIPVAAHDPPRPGWTWLLADAAARRRSATEGGVVPDYATLRFIWWLILGTLLIGFAIMDGFDFGLAATFRSLGRTDEERRALLESVEPVWEGNQVWFILAGGAVFAAWPLLYAASFSGLYLAMFVLLVALILRPVGFVFRNKVADPRWRNVWDWVLTIAGIVPALLFGVAFGNLFLGVPFHFDALRTPGLHRQLRVAAAPLRAARRSGEPGDDRDAR